MKQNNKPKSNLEQMEVLAVLASACQGLISILPEEEAPYEIEVTNENGELSVIIKGNQGIKLSNSVSVSKEIGEYFVESFRNYFINERDITVSYFAEIPWPQFSKYKYGKNHKDIDANIAKAHVIQNHMYTFIVNRYYGICPTDELAHHNALTKMNEANQKVMK